MNVWRSLYEERIGFVVAIDLARFEELSSAPETTARNRTRGRREKEEGEIMGTVSLKSTWKHAFEGYTHRQQREHRSRTLHTGTQHTKIDRQAQFCRVLEHQTQRHPTSGSPHQARDLCAQHAIPNTHTGARYLQGNLKQDPFGGMAVEEDRKCNHTHA